MKPSPRFTPSSAGFVATAVLVAALSFTRIALSIATDLEPGMIGGPTRASLLLPYLFGEIVMLAVASGLLGIASGVRVRVLAWGARLGLALLLVAMTVDVVLFATLNTRFFGGFVLYVREPAAIWHYGLDALGAVGTVGALLAFAALATFPLWVPLRPGRKTVVGAFLFALFGAGVAFAPAPGTQVGRWKRVSLLELNLPNPERIRYASRPTYTPPAPSIRNLHTTADSRDVILLLVESWSSYQSAAFGGIHDWTPALDAIAREHTRFDHFYAGGYDTNDGLIHLLGGAQLWMPFGFHAKLDIASGRWDQRPTLPRLFRDQGYHTAFFTPGPIAFSGKDRWLAAIGFDEVEGSSHPFYHDWPRLTFDAAPDEALYRRTLAWLDAPHPGRFFLTLETVSTHSPGLDPSTGERGTKAAFRYADRWAAWFCSELRRRGFFEHGILLITGDHRAMTAATPAEIRQMGPLFSARVPLVLVDGTSPPGGIVSEHYQQSDLLPSFRHWLGQPVSLDERSASLFEPPPRVGSVIVHRRGSERGWIDILTPREGSGVILVHGDKTAFASSEGLDAAERHRILQLVAVERVTNDP